MKHTQFSKIIKNFFDEFLKQIFLKVGNREFKIEGEYSYPSYLRIGVSPHHLIAELMGSKDVHSVADINIFRPISCEKLPNTSSFFNPGPISDESKSAIFHVGDTKFFGLSKLSISTNYDKEIFLKKINFPLSATQLESKNLDLPLIIKPECKSLLFRHIDIIRTDSYRVYYRAISTAIAVEKNISPSNLEKWLNDQANKFFNSPQPDIIGLNIGYPHSTETFARELASLTNQMVKENIIDKFIQKHMEFFTKALGYKKGFSQVKLKWVEREKIVRDPIKPDFLMQREDGYFDILDIKTSALKYKSIVRGGRKNRYRFNSYVSELIGQLDGYERYFDSEENRKWALENYKIKVKNPRLIGIVGNHQNFNRDDVDLVLRQYKDNITVISYADLVNLLRKIPS